MSEIKGLASFSVFIVLAFETAIKSFDYKLLTFIRTRIVFDCFKGKYIEKEALTLRVKS